MESTVNSVIKVVALAFDLETSDLKLRRRDGKVALARQVAMYVSWRKDGCTLAQIGHELGGRSPAAVSHGFQKIASCITTDPVLKDKISQIEQVFEISQG